MHLLTSNFNLLHTNSSWTQLKKYNFNLDPNFNNFYFVINETKNFTKYQSVHILLNLNSRDKIEILKKIRFIKKNSKKFGQIFIYISLDLNKINSKKIINYLNKKLNNIRNINFQFYIEKKIKFNKRNEEILKFPYDISAIDEISKTILYNVKLFNSKPYKLIIVDCDNTLWGGVLDEDGYQRLDYSKNKNGKLYKRFQIFLKSLQKKGFILSLSSKNNEKEVWKTMKNLKMILQKKDFIAPKINWEEKPGNIKQILTDLSLRAEDTIFIDDNFLEIQKVKNKIKGITCMQFHPKTIFKNLDNDFRLKKSKVLKEDYIKHKQYKLKSNFEKLRQKRDSYTNSVQFMKSLKQKVEIINCNKKNFERALQLIHKTNQFNLSLNRYSNTELNKIIHDKSFSTKLINFKDKFGNHGLIGMFIYKKNEKNITITDFMLSCRVLYRNIEDFMIYSILKLHNDKKIFIHYNPTALNSQLAPLFLKKDFFKIFRQTNLKKIYKINYSKTFNETKKIFN